MYTLPYCSPVNPSVINHRKHCERIPAIKSLAHHQESATAYFLVDRVSFAPKNVSMARDVAKATD